MKEDVDQKQRVAKRIVIVLGVLLALCFVIVVGTIVYRLATKGEVLPVGTPPSAAKTVETGSASFDIPAGTRVVGVSAEGANYLVLVTDGHTDSLLVVDRTSGATIKTIQFVPRASTRPGK